MSHRKKYSGPKDFDFRQLATCVNAISANIKLFADPVHSRHACQTTSIQLRKLLLESTSLIPRCYKRNVLKFHPIKEVPLADKPFHTSSIGMREGGYLEFQLANSDGTPNSASIPERLTIAPSSTFMKIYPLPGVSHDACNNQVIFSTPFDLNEHRLINLNQWLAQKMVSICGHDMTLWDILKTIANEEGAHARDFSMDTESKIYIAEQFTFGGFSYFHWIVMYTASYLVGRIFKFSLHRNKLIRVGVDEIAELNKIAVNDEFVMYQATIEMVLHFGENQPGRITEYVMKPCENN